MIIAFTGVAGSGKSTAGAYLVGQHGFTQMGFADPLRAMALTINPVIGSDYDNRGDEYSVRYADAIERIGYELMKYAYPESRAFLQSLGQSARDNLGQNVWVHAAEIAIDRHRVQGRFDIVITDCRYQNEAGMVRALGGYVIAITRPGIEPVRAHESERPLPADLLDATINNGGTPDDLKMLVEEALERLKLRAGGARG